MSHLTLGKKASPDKAQTVKVPARNSKDEMPSGVSGLELTQAAGNLALQNLLATGQIQAKLSISQPSDPDEQEADQVANRIMRMPSSAGPTCPTCASGESTCSSCAAKQSEPDKIYRKHLAGPAHAASYTHPLLRGSGSGRSLDKTTRSFFEPRLGHDLSAVRIHTGAESTNAARSIQARAFTSGREIFFADGQYSPDTDDGRRLLAHELTHVVQQAGRVSSGAEIHRQPAAPPTTDPNPQKTSNDFPPRPGSERADFRGVLLADDRVFMKAQLQRLIAREGLAGADAWHAMLLGARPPGGLPAPVPPAHLWGTGGLRVRSPLDAQRDIQNEASLKRLTPMVSDVYKTEVRPEAVKFLDDFEKQAKANAEATLKANEEQATAEGIRYGIKSEQISKIRYQATGEGPRVPVLEVETKHSMDKDSPAAMGLRDAAKVLLKRRQKIDEKSRELRRHIHCFKGECSEDAKYEVVLKELQELEGEYDNLRTYLSAQYPILSGLSERSKGTGDLEDLTKGPGKDMAAVLGGEIQSKFANIHKVREGLSSGDVNVWRQPKMVDLTRVQLGAKDDPMKARLVNDKVESEQPGILATLALVVLNIAALLLAGPTGGLSLVVAAGVNVAVTAEHIKEFMMQSALSGTAFDRAQAISSEEPSLFWLAVEIVGTALDVGPAASTLIKGFKTLAPLVKTAQVATKGEEAVKSLQAVRTAATEVKGAEFAEKVVAQVKNLQKGEAAVLEGAKLTADETKLLGKAAKTAEEAAASGVGKGLKTATGEINLSKSGHIFSCASPCVELGDKYAKVFAQGGELNSDFVKLQQRAHDIAQAEKVAKEGKDVKAIAAAEEAAEQLKKDAAALEKRILDTHPEFAPIPTEDAAANAIKQVEAESSITQGRLSSDPKQLEKFKPTAERAKELGVDPNDPLWKDYVSYFEDRLQGLKSGAKEVKPPLEWAEYSDFLGKFRRGNEYQKGVLQGLENEAKLPAGERKLFQGMQDPIVESNVGVAGKNPGDTTKFADQLVVDKATIGAGKTPNCQVFSNKSRVWPDKLGLAERSSVRSQVVADVEEALTKYGGDITVRRPGPLFNQTLKPNPVYLVYDKALVKTADLERAITDAASGVKINGQGVIVIFR